MTVQKSFYGSSVRSLQLQEVNTFDLLNNLLYITSKALNVKENINEFQAFDIINTLLEDYKDVKMEEFIYIFKQGKKGIYGPHYNKFDIETIVNWINKYFESNEYNDFLENRHKTIIEKVELTNVQKESWKNILDNFKQLHPEQKTEADYMKSFSNDELKNLLSEYTSLNFEDGIKMINKEINRRSK